MRANENGKVDHSTAVTRREALQGIADRGDVVAEDVLPATAISMRAAGETAAMESGAGKRGGLAQLARRV